MSDFFGNSGFEDAQKQAQSNLNTATSYAGQALSQPAPAPTYEGLQPGAGKPADVGFNGNVPGAGENVSNAFLQHYGQTGIPAASNNASLAYSNFQQNAGAAPGPLAAQNMSSYYDNASRLQANALNTQMAARGSYGSSNAIGQLGNAETNLRAQQARDEAQYGLQVGQYDLSRANYGLSRAGAEGSLASASDASSRGASADERDWMTGLSDLGFKNQKEGAARYELGNADALQAASISSGIQGDVGQAEINSQQQLLYQQLIAQGMSASDAATAAANQVNDQRASNDQTAGYVNKAGEALGNYV